MTRFADELRASCVQDWNAARDHRFVRELFAGSISSEAMRRYLIQDYQFIDVFVSLLGMAIATADNFSARIRFAQFAAMITSDENTYFVRAFDALGVPEQERARPLISEPTAALQSIMQAAAQSGSYPNCVAVLAVAEWLYLDWADRPDQDLPEDFVHAEWITLHNNEGFRAFVEWLRCELDRVGAKADDTSRAQAGDFFRRAVKAERAFFDHIYV